MNNRLGKLLFWGFYAFVVLFLAAAIIQPIQQALTSCRGDYFRLLEKLCTVLGSYRHVAVMHKIKHDSELIF